MGHKNKDHLFVYKETIKYPWSDVPSRIYVCEVCDQNLFKDMTKYEAAKWQEERRKSV